MSIGAVILAAGGSSRFGCPKQLLEFHGETLVRRVVRAATEAQCDPVIVVAGEQIDAIRQELKGSAAVVIGNPNWQRGVGTSIRTGMQNLSDSVAAVVLLTCDQPMVDAAVIRQLLRARQETGKPIVASSYANTFGIPALFDRSLFSMLQNLPDESGAKALIAARPDDVASIVFEAGAIDIDTPEDFARLISPAG